VFPTASPFEPDTILNCLPKFVSTAEPVCVTESSVRCTSAFPAWKSSTDPVSRCKFKDPGFKLCLNLALFILIT